MLAQRDFRPEIWLCEKEEGEEYFSARAVKFVEKHLLQNHQQHCENLLVGCRHRFEKTKLTPKKPIFFRTPWQTLSTRLPAWNLRRHRF